MVVESTRHTDHPPEAQSLTVTTQSTKGYLVWDMSTALLVTNPYTVSLAEFCPPMNSPTILPHRVEKYT